jgi:hypothetical protein
VSILPFGRGFSRHGVFRCDGVLGGARTSPHAPFIVSMSPPGCPSAWLRPRSARFRFARQDHCSSATTCRFSTSGLPLTPPEPRSGQTRKVSVIAFHEKAGQSQVGWFRFRWTRFFLQPSHHAVATLPSALSMSDFRSVQVECSRFSRCCHLFSDLRSIWKMEVGQAIDAVTGTRRVSFCLSFRRMFFALCGCWHSDRAAIP